MCINLIYIVAIFIITSNICINVVGNKNRVLIINPRQNDKEVTPDSKDEKKVPTFFYYPFYYPIYYFPYYIPSFYVLG